MNPLATLPTASSGPASATAEIHSETATLEEPGMEGASELVVDAEQASDFMKFLEFAGMQLAAALPDGVGLPPAAGGLPRMEQLLMPGATDMAAQQQVQFDRLLDGAGRLQMTSALAGQDESAAAVGESRLVDSLLSGGLAGVQSNASATRSLPAMGLRLDMPVGQPEWNQSLGDRLQWMIGRNIQQAEVRLSPPPPGATGDSRVAAQRSGQR